jgi:hypothetical protein
VDLQALSSLGARSKRQHVGYHTLSFLELEINKHDSSSGLVTCGVPTFMRKLRYEGKKERFYKKIIIILSTEIYICVEKISSRHIEELCIYKF